MHIATIFHEENEHRGLGRVQKHQLNGILSGKYTTVLKIATASSSTCTKIFQTN